jgi:RND family efflux transporter MFP subunit
MRPFVRFSEAARVILLAGRLSLPAIFLALALFGCQSAPQQQRQQEEVTPTPIPTQPAPVNPVYTVTRGDVISKIEFTGRISPVLEQELFFQTDGRVRRVLVERNQEVKKGQLLADLEIDDLERQLAITELNIRRNEVNLEMAELELEYIKAQYPSKDQKHQVELAERRLELQRIAMEEASLNLEDLKASIAAAQIIAPFDGALLFVNISKGAAATGYKSVITIADLNALEVSADVNTELLRDLEEGMEVSGTFYSKPGEVFKGVIRRLPYPYGGGTGASDILEDDQSTRVTFDIPEDTDFELGDLIRVTVVIKKSENALWLPPQAIRNFEGRKFVLVQEGEVQRRVDVKTGLTSEDRVEITEGLEENQVVIGP